VSADETSSVCRSGLTKAAEKVSLICSRTYELNRQTLQSIRFWQVVAWTWCQEMCHCVLWRLNTMRITRYICRPTVKSSDETQYHDSSIKAQLCRMRLQTIINGVLGKSMKMTVSCVDQQCRENGIDGAATCRNDGKTTKRDNNPWLTSLLVFCNNVSVLGLRYVVNMSASAWRRAIWLLLVLMGAALTAYQIQERIVYFFSYPVNVIVREEYTNEMLFPTVTICNENRISLSKMTAIGTYR